MIVAKALALVGALSLALAAAGRAQQEKTTMSTPTGSNAPASKTLENVPKIGFYEGGPRPPEDDLLPAAIGAFLESRGEDLGFAAQADKTDGWHPWHDVHVYLMGATGSAFRLLWNRGKWDHSIISPFVMLDDAVAPIRLGLRAAGYRCDILLRDDVAAQMGVRQGADGSEEHLRSRIVDGIGKYDKPVIGIGVVGPAEACLITGYDEGGEVLVGWSGFQKDPNFAEGLEFDAAGRFRKRDWYKDTLGIAVIVEKGSLPPPAEVYRAALRRGLAMMRTPEVRGLLAGQAAYTAWAEALLRNDQFSKDRMAELRERCELHSGLGGTLAEARAWGACFLVQAAKALPPARQELLDAARCFNDEHDLVWAIWEFTKGERGSDESALKFADAGTRGRIVPLIRLARRRDAEAAGHLERALRALDEADGLDEAARKYSNPRGWARREKGVAIVDGVPALAWGKGRDCTFIGALEAATAVTRHPASYDEMMGATGLAFRVRWSNPDTKGGWTCSCPCGEFVEEFEDVSRATGWKLDARFDPVNGGLTDPGMAAIHEAIGVGMPLIGQVGGHDVGVFCGFTEDGAQVVANCYGHAAGKKYGPRQIGTWRIFLVGRDEPLPVRDALLMGLRTAGRNRHRGKSSERLYGPLGYEWFYGASAFDAWIGDLEKRDLAGLAAKDRKAYYDQSRFNHVSLLDARQAAVRYLVAQAKKQTGAAAASLTRAAQAYERETVLLAAPVEAKAPWLGTRAGSAETWTAASRAEEARILREAREQEAEAIRHLQEAAAAMDADPLVHPAGSERVVLGGVPKIGYQKRFCPFPGALEALMEYIGDPVDYDFLMGVTGAAFRRFWEKDDGGNVDLMYLEPEPYRRALEELGYEYRHIPRERDAMLQAIKQSISNGRPVISFGIVGPPEAGLITGYDRDGEVLIGWSYFQQDTWPGTFEQPDWHQKQDPNSLGLVVVEDKDRWFTANKRDTLVRALKWAIDLSRTPTRTCAPKHVSGLAAYAAWAAALEVDADYPSDDPGVLDTRHMVQCDQAVMVEERGNAARFLRQMAEAAPEVADDLNAAAELYEKVGQEAGPVYPWGENWKRPDLADPAVRREIARHVRAAAELEAQAVEHLEKALAALVGEGG